MRVLGETRARENAHSRRRSENLTNYALLRVYGRHRLDAHFSRRNCLHVPSIRSHLRYSRISFRWHVNGMGRERGRFGRYARRRQNGSRKNGGHRLLSLAGNATRGRFRYFYRNRPIERYFGPNQFHDANENAHAIRHRSHRVLRVFGSSRAQIFIQEGASDEHCNHVRGICHRLRRHRRGWRA